MDNILYIFLLIIIVVGLGLIMFSLKHKKNLDRSKSTIIQNNNESIHSNMDMGDINKTDSMFKAIKPDERNHYDLSKLTDIVLKNSLGQEITFTRPDELTEMKYQEVIISETIKIAGHFAQGAMPILGNASTLSEIARMAPNGLFTATVDPSNLSKFGDGTITTMVRDTTNNLVGHAGFQSVENTIQVNPLFAVNVGMHAMAAISGQYYLNQIFGELDGINSNLEKLIEFHHDEKIGILLNTKDRLSEIIQRKNVDESDIYEIRDLRNKIGEVFQEYKIRLDREHGDIIKFKPKAMLVEKRVGEYGKKINEMCFTFQVCFEADRLSMQSELAEIAVRMKLNYEDPMLEELFEQLKHNSENSFSISIDDIIKDTFKPINSKAKEIVGDGKDLFFIDKNRNKLLKSIFDKHKKLEAQFNSKAGNNIIYKALSERGEHKEVIIMPDKELKGQRIFIPMDENNQL